MYLFVFIFLLLSIAGLYTEVYMLQVAKMAANQKAIAQTMLTWHGGAALFAKNNSLGASATGCLVTASLSLSGLGIPCASQLAVTNTSYLPLGYSDNFRWYSVAYRPGSITYVLTFVRPPSSGILTDPIEQPDVGFSVADVWRQIKIIGAPKTSYGAVQSVGGLVQFVTPDAPAGATKNYALPSCGANCVPVGSVGFLTPL